MPKSASGLIVGKSGRCRAVFFSVALCVFAATQIFIGAADGQSTTAPAVSAMFPAAGARDVCVDTPLRLTFSAPPVIGAGKIKILDGASNAVVQSVDVSDRIATQSIGGLPNFKYYPVIVSGKEATIYLPNGSLAYNKTYRVTIDAGAFKNEGGPYGGISDATNWQFTTKAAPRAPAARSWPLPPTARGISAPCRARSTSCPTATRCAPRFSCTRGPTAN